MSEPRFVPYEAVMIGSKQVGRITKSADGYTIVICGESGGSDRNYRGICQSPEEARKIALRLFGNPPGQGVLFQERTTHAFV